MLYQIQHQWQCRNTEQSWKLVADVSRSILEVASEFTLGSRSQAVRKICNKENENHRLLRDMKKYHSVRKQQDWKYSILFSKQYWCVRNTKIVFMASKPLFEYFSEKCKNSFHVFYLLSFLKAQQKSTKDLTYIHMHTIFRSLHYCK